MSGLTVIIPTHDRPQGLHDALEALDAQKVKTVASVVVVDDHSKPSHQRENRSACERVGATYLFNDAASGPATARNMGIKAATSDWVAFLDDDVVPRGGWLHALQDEIERSDPSVVGIEGAVEAMANGLWDGEVTNASGKAYLACNIAYRRKAVVEVGCFDERFRGPFGEDHELACRMLKKGTISFCAAMIVGHAVRSRRPWRHLVRAPSRIRLLLVSELQFYLAQPDDYGRFRIKATFWQTYRAVALRHLITCLRRRGARALLRHPFQASFLVAASLVEQVAAIGYGGGLLELYRRMSKEYGR